jgi:hypothetical protein
MTKVDGLMIQWIVGVCRAQIDKIFGGLDLKVLLAHRPGKTRNRIAATSIK